MKKTEYFILLPGSRNQAMKYILHPEKEPYKPVRRLPLWPAWLCFLAGGLLAFKLVGEMVQGW